MATKFSMDVKNKNPSVKKLYGSFNSTGTATTNITNCTVSKSANGLFNIKMNYTYYAYLSVLQSQKVLQQIMFIPASKM